MGTTLAALQAGGTTQFKLIAAIEGCPYIITEDLPSAAVLTAWAGTDYSQVLGGLFVELQNKQKLDLHNPFTSGGRCTIHVLDTDRTDVFGKLVNRRAAGAETSIAATIDRDDTAISVRFGSGLAASGECFVGTECIGYSARTSTTVTASSRGKYSPFKNGNGGTRFSNHHRVGVDPNHVQLNPTLSQQPRVWVGKRVGIWMHTWDGTTLNLKSEAQLIYAGRIAGISDDANTFRTVLDCKHILEEVREAVIGKDLWSATLAEGIWLAAGRTFTFSDVKVGSGKNANAMVVNTLAGGGGSSPTNILEGFYTNSELCEKLSGWLAAEKVAGRINGTYRWASPVSTNEGLRTRCDWKIEHASSVTCSWGLNAPAEVCAFLGLSDTEPSQNGQVQAFWSGDQLTNRELQTAGKAVPFRSVVFRPYGPGRVGQEFSEAIVYDAENERGTFIDQLALLPAAIKEGCAPGNTWGMFLLDDKSLMVGSYSGGRLTNCWLAPFQIAGDKDTSATGYVGRRADEQEQGTMSLRQVYVLEASFETLINTFFYNTGTSGYNHATYDNLSFGLGIGVPGELLGSAWEKSVSNLPGSSAALAVIIDEPTKLSDLIGADLLIRNAFLRWKNGHLELARWKTPTATDAVLTLTEENKAAPVTQEDNHRIASVESTDFQRPITKLDYCRDFAVGRAGTYLKSVMVEDQVAVDDGGGDARPFTLKMRNTYSQFASTGLGVEALIADFIAMRPIVSRPARKIQRTLDLRYFEGYSVGDVAIVDDDFARDPLTGTRGILLRPALITEIMYDLGGPSTDGEAPRDMGGTVELFFLDLNRHKRFGPSAQVDDTQANAGYNAGTGALTCYANKNSETGEAADASWLRNGDAITIVQIDPDDPTAGVALSWDRTIATVVGNVITPTAPLAAPAWDATKKYRIIPSKWSLTNAVQRDFAFQADDADEMIEDTEVPYLYAVADETLGLEVFTGGGRWRTATPNVGTELAEFVAAITYGDGKSEDVGTLRSMIKTANAYIDRKSAHQNPVLFNTVTQGMGVGSTTWLPMYAGVIFNGAEHLTAAVTRTLTVAPFLRSITGGTGKVRATLTRTKPTPAAGSYNTQYADARFTDLFSSTTWTTTNTTFTTGADQTLSLGVKDMWFGTCWLVVEVQGDVESYGLAKCIEGVRSGVF